MDGLDWCCHLLAISRSISCHSRNKMHAYEGANSVMEGKVFIESEEIEEEPSELTATPLKKYVTVVRSRKEGSACKWICNFGCRSEPYTGTYSRMRAHLIGLLPGQKSQGVALCPKVNKEGREKMKREEVVAKRTFGGSTHRVPLKSIPIASPICKTSLRMKTENGTKDSVDSCTRLFRHEIDEVIARFFYGNGIPIDVAESYFWVDMVKAINEAPKGYKSPSVEKITTTLLDKEKSKVEQALMPLKQRWPTYGVSIVLDGWTTIKNQPILQVMSVSEGKAMFITGVYCSREEKSCEFIAELLLKAIEIVGAVNVVQVLTDNASVCRSAGEIVETKHPHIFWSACMSHTLSLLMNDITNSMHPSLDFIGDSYRRTEAIVKYIKCHKHLFQKFSTLDVIQAENTRLGHQFVVFEYVLLVKNALISMVLSEEWEKLETSGSNSNLEHEEMKQTILDDDFWKKVKTILELMKPIWGMIRFCDSCEAFIGEIYQRIEDMLRCIKESLIDNVETYQVIKDIVMARRNEMNLPLYSLAYVLTPHYYSESWLTSLDFGGEKKRKPHADPNVYKTYLDALDRLAKDSKEAHLARQQLSDFVSNRDVFACHQSIKDRETMPAISWWNLYGVTATELYSVAVRVLCQSVNSSCVERAWSAYGYINSVKRKKMDIDRAESLLFVYYNHRLLTRYREEYEGTCKNWYNFVDDDDLENDMKAIEAGEYCIFHEDQVSHVTPRYPSSSTATYLPPHAPTQGSSTSTEVQRVQETVNGKRACVG